MWPAPITRNDSYWRNHCGPRAARRARIERDRADSLEDDRVACVRRDAARRPAFDWTIEFESCARRVEGCPGELTSTAGLACSLTLVASIVCQATAAEGTENV
jgi:hypothetical protein